MRRGEREREGERFLAGERSRRRGDSLRFLAGEALRDRERDRPRLPSSSSLLQVDNRPGISMVQGEEIDSLRPLCTHPLTLRTEYKVNAGTRRTRKILATTTLVL